MMPAMWYGLSQDGKDKEDRPKAFQVPIYGGVFDVFDVLLSLGKAPMPSPSVVMNTLTSIPLPFLTLARVLRALSKDGNAPTFNDNQAFGSLFYVISNAGAGALFVIFHFM